MLQVDIEKIIPVTEARDMFNKIVDEVEGTDEMYVLTKNGKPSAVVVGVNHLEKLTGSEGSEVMANIVDLNNDAPTETPASTIPTDAVEPALVNDTGDAAIDPFSVPTEETPLEPAPVVEPEPAPITQPETAVQPEPVASAEIPAQFANPVPDNSGFAAPDASASTMPNLPPVEEVTVAPAQMPQTPPAPINPVQNQPVPPTPPQNM